MRSEENSSSIQLEGYRLAAIVISILFLFMVGRSAPLPDGTYWDLVFARDYDLNIGWAMLPESISLMLVNSASLFGLRVLYHLCFFVISCFLIHLAFRGEEILPGIIVSIVFTFAFQPLLSLRSILMLFFIGGTYLVLDGDSLKGAFGALLVPVFAAASALTVNVWLLVAMVAFYVFFHDEYQPSLLLCALIGILFFPEGAATAITIQPTPAQLMQPFNEVMLLYLGAGIVMVPNIISLPRLTNCALPNLAFYAFTGIWSLLDPTVLPAFIFMGTIILLANLAEITPLSANAHIFGIIFLMAVTHIFLYLHPVRLKLNTEVHNELGAALTPLVENREMSMEIENHNLGELYWKGLLTIDQDDIFRLLKRDKYLVVKHRTTGITLVPDPGDLVNAKPSSRTEKSR